MASFNSSGPSPSPSVARATSFDLLSTSRRARSTALVLLVAPVAAMTLASNASSMCNVIFMPAKVWQTYHTVNFFLKYTL